MNAETVEHFIFCLTVWREARGIQPGKDGSVPEQVAVAATIRNRAKDPGNRWPKTIQGVCLQRKQFSCFNQDDPNVSKFPIPSDTLEWEAWVRCCKAVEMSETWDPTNGANHYHSIPPSRPKPAWADPRKITHQAGPFTFFKL